MDIWQRLTLVLRQQAVTLAVLLAAGLLMVLLNIAQEARDARAELRETLSHELETLPAALADALVVGDHASLQRNLDTHALRPLLQEIRFRDSSGRNCA